MEGLLGLLPLVFNGLGSLFGGGSNPKTTQTTKSDTSATGTAQVGTQETLMSQRTGEETGTATSTQEVVNQNLNATTAATLKEQLDKLFSTSAENRQVSATELKRVTETPAFDQQGFINSVVTGARNDIDSSLESNINQLYGGAGASGGTNSAVALLENKMRNQGASTVEGVRSAATAEAAQIGLAENQTKTQQVMGLTGQLDTQLSQLLGGLLQANNKSIQTGTEATTAESTATAQDSTTGLQMTEQSENTKTGKVGTSREGTAASGFFEALGKMFGAQF